MPGLAADRGAGLAAEARHAEDEYGAEQDHAERNRDAADDRCAARELPPGAIAGRLRDASSDLCVGVDDDLVTAAVDNLPADARIRPEAQVFAGKFDVAIDASVDDDALAIGAEVPGDGTVHDDRSTGERGIVSDPGLGRDAKGSARHADVLLHLSCEPHVAAGRVEIPPDKAVDQDIAAAHEGVPGDPVTELHVSACQKLVAAERGAGSVVG